MSATPYPLDQAIEPLLPAAYTLLRRLGVTENYKGFWYAAYAAALTSIDPDCLLLVTKRLYPDVARRFGTTWKAVERNLRTVAYIAWTKDHEYLSCLSQSPLEQKPQCAQFLAILSRSLLPTQLSCT